MRISINQHKSPDISCAQSEQEYEFSVAVEHDLEALRPYFAMLDELATNAIEPNIFYEPWMFLPALENYSSGVTMSFLLVKANAIHDGGHRLVGFFPMESRKSYRGLPLRNLTLWRYPHCFLATPLLHRDFVRKGIQALLAWFQSQRRYSLMELHTQSAHGPYYRQLREVLAESQLKIVEESYERAFLSVDTDAENYLKTALSRKLRHEQRRQTRRLQDLGDMRWESLSEDGSIDTWIKEFLQLEASGWKGRSGSAMHLSDHDRMFFQNIAAEAFSCGRLDILALRLNDKFLAMMVLLLTEDGCFAFKHAYDEDYRSYGPGILLFIELIKHVHNSEALNWLDTCTAPDNALLNKLFMNRKPMCNLAAAKVYSPGAGLVQLLPALARAKKRFVNR